MDDLGVAFTSKSSSEIDRAYVLNKLPSNNLEYIFSYLNAQDLQQIGLVCKKFALLTPKIFRNLVKRKWEHIITSPSQSHDSVDSVLRQEVIEKNMIEGRAATFKFPNQYVSMKKTLVSGNKIILQNENGNFENWDNEKSICLATINSSQTDKIDRLHLFKDMLVVVFSGLMNASYYMMGWNIHTGKHLFRLENIHVHRIWKFDNVPYLFILTASNRLSAWDIENVKNCGKWQVSTI